MSAGPDWPAMFKALAEGWNWEPEKVERLTPHQLISLSGKSGSGTGAGGAIQIHHPSQYEDYQRMWQAWNSEEAVLARAEKEIRKYTTG